MTFTEEYRFKIRKYIDEDWDSLYEFIDDHLEIEFDNWDNKYLEHDKIILEIEDKSIIKELLSYELPSPKHDDKEDGVYFSARFTVKEVDGNSAKVELEFVEHYGDYVNLDEIVWEVKG